MSPWGYLLFTLWSAVLAVLLHGWQLAGLAAVQMAFGWAWSREALRMLRRPRFWIFVLTAVAVGPFLIGEPDLVLGPLRISREGWAVGVEMAGRAFVLTLAFSVGIGALSLSDVVAVFDRVGLRGLGFAVGVAMNLFGTLREMATVTFQTLWLRGGRRRPWLTLRLFLITTVANTLRYGDEVVSAAAMRAFDPTRGGSGVLPLRRADLWLLAALAVCTGIFFS